MTRMVGTVYQSADRGHLAVPNASISEFGGVSRHASLPELEFLLFFAHNAAGRTADNGSAFVVNATVCYVPPDTRCIRWRPALMTAELGDQYKLSLCFTHHARLKQPRSADLDLGAGRLHNQSRIAQSLASNSFPQRIYVETRKL